MQIRQLKHFIAAMESGSMTLASTSQNITQPTLSRSIASLEQELGVALFERGHRGVLPTRYGELLADHARSLLAEYERTLDEVGAMRSGGLGHVRIGIGSIASDPRIAASLAEIATSSTDLTLTIESDIPENQLAKLRRGELDALIESRRADHDIGDLDFRPVADVSMVVVARAEHPVHALGNLQGKELLRWPWAIFHQPNAEAFYRELLCLTDEFLDIRLRSSSTQMLRQILLSSDLIGMMNRGEIADCLEDGRLREIASDVRCVETNLCLVTRRRSRMSGALQAVLSKVHQALREKAHADCV